MTRLKRIVVRVRVTVGMSVTVAVLASSFALVTASARSQGEDWTIPNDALRLTSPIAPTPAALKKGQALFKSNCEKCHGPQGKGDGPYADPSHRPANLAESNASENPDGVLFYKIWNGKKPMPAFKSLITKDEAWTVAEYAKSLRTP
jgi:mono/diheme cytochrome c family protein